MGQAETTGERALDSVSDSGASGTPRAEASGATDIEIPPMVQKAIERHRLDLDELMKHYEYQWAAYRGQERLEIGKSKRSLYRKYLDCGLTLDELVVLGIGPQVPDVLDGEEWSHI